jgi:hypothetical protein
LFWISNSQAKRPASVVAWHRANSGFAARSSDEVRLVEPNLHSRIDPQHSRPPAQGFAVFGQLPIVECGHASSFAKDGNGRNPFRELKKIIRRLAATSPSDRPASDRRSSRVDDASTFAGGHGENANIDSRTSGVNARRQRVEV